MSVHAVRRALKQERARESEEQGPPAETRVETVACEEEVPRVDTTTWGYSSWKLTVPPVKAEERKQSFGGQGYWTEIKVSLNITTITRLLRNLHFISLRRVFRAWGSGAKRV